MCAFSSSGSDALAARTFASLTRNESGAQPSSLSDQSRTAASPRSSMSSSIAETVSRTSSRACAGQRLGALQELGHAYAARAGAWPSSAESAAAALITAAPTSP